MEAIATEATLQLEKLVEEEVGEVGGNFDYIENLLDARPEGALHNEHSEKEGKERLNLALSDDEDEGVDEEDMVFTHMLVEDVEDISKEMEAIATEATLQLEKLVEEEVGEVGGNFDYIENLLDARPVGAWHNEHSEKEGKETLNIALSGDEDEGVGE